MADDKKSQWSKAFAEIAKQDDITGKDKTEKFKELARLKNSMSSNEPRTNDVNKSTSPTRQAFIDLARERGVTSAEDRARVAASKSAGASNFGNEQNPNVIPIPTPMGGEDKITTNDYRSNYNDIDWTKKAKGGLVHRGQGRVIRHKTTRHH
jgi:hypothetical protein